MMTYLPLLNLLDTSMCSSSWTSDQRDKAYAIIGLANLTLTTSYKDDDRLDANDSQTLYPVLRRLIRDLREVPDKIHNDLVVFEPNPDDMRYKYARNRLEPSQLCLRIDSFRIRWSLEPELHPSHHDTRNGRDTFIPTTNATREGPEGCFTIFHYLHSLDVRKEYPLNVYYREYDDSVKLRLHCVGIPLGLLRLLLKMAQEGRNTEF